MKLYLVRHGEDTPGYRGGWARTHLTLNGEKQIKDLATYIKENNINFEYIISSDLVRAKESALILSNLLNKKLYFNVNFREYNNGAIAGLDNEYADKHYPEYIFAKIGMDDRFPGGETPREYFKRIKNALDEVIKEGKDVLIVSHGGVIDVINHIYNNVPYSNNSDFKVYFENAKIYEFEFK